MQSFFSMQWQDIKRKRGKKSWNLVEPLTNVIMNSESNEVGVIGLGYMGCSIVAALLMQGYKVVAVAPLESDLELAPGRILHALDESFKQGIHKQDVATLKSKVFFTKSYKDLKDCFLISECVVENVDIKKKVYSLIESSVSDGAMITTNTSALPITILQDTLTHPGRFLGMHWAEPAFTTPFLEIICGPKTTISVAETLYKIATGWGKEPTLLR